MNSPRRRKVCVVDDRTFLKGLDFRYRAAMRVHEQQELLACARELCQVLEVEPADVPVEGYYSEHPDLAEYFRRMRALQLIPGSERPRVEQLAAFQRLLGVVSSPLFGTAGSRLSLLPQSIDPLSTALRQVDLDHWSVATLTAAAQRIAREGEDFSLVGLAAFAGDAVILAALRETVVLYAMAMAGGVGEPVEIVFEWRVDPLLAERGRKFVTTFNDLFAETLPLPQAEAAESYWMAATMAHLPGRCVRIGYDDRTLPHRQYHWAVCESGEAEVVHEFWSEEIWTTERFRELMYSGEPLP